MATAAQALVREQLSAVTFVQDYWQLAFDGSGFTVFSSITVTGPDWQVRDDDVEFRNRLCERIGRLVAKVSVDLEAVRLVFDDDTQISLSLQEAHYTGPEALTFQAFGQGVLYVL